MQTVNQVAGLNYTPQQPPTKRGSLWSLQTVVDGNDVDLSVAVSIINGALLGLAWATLFRLWMRLVSDKPEFSVSGTAMLLGAAMLVGGCAGLSYATRRRGVSRRAWVSRLVSIGSFAALGIGPGMIVMPTILFATLALARKKWHPLIRALCGLTALLGVGLIAKIILSFWPPAPSAIYLSLYLIFLYPAIIAMRMGVAEAEPPKPSLT